MNPTHQPPEGRDWDDIEEVTELIGEGRFRDALAELKKVLATNPRNPYAYHYLGAALFEVGELAAARDAYRASLRLSPSYLGSMIGLAHVERMLGNGRESVQLAQSGLQEFPNAPDLLHAAGLAYALLGDRTAAVRYLNAYLASNPPYEIANETRELLAKLVGLAQPS
jgi:Flp pilus assembly protein TadD